MGEKEKLYFWDFTKEKNRENVDFIPGIVEEYKKRKLLTAFYEEKILLMKSGWKDPQSRQLFERCETALLPVFSLTDEARDFLVNAAGGYNEEALLNTPLEFALPEDTQKALEYSRKMGVLVEQFNERMAALLNLDREKDFVVACYEFGSDFMDSMIVGAITPISFYVHFELKARLLYHLFELCEKNPLFS